MSIYWRTVARTCPVQHLGYECLLVLTYSILPPPLQAISSLEQKNTFSGL